MADQAVGVLAALAAALAYGLGSVLQQRGASSVQGAGRVGPRLLGRLARSRIWLAGISGDAVGFVLRAVALGVSALSLVGPLIASSLLFALGIQAIIQRRRLSRRQLCGASFVTAGITIFLWSARPEGGGATATSRRWLGVIGVAAAFTLVCWWFSRRRSGPDARSGAPRSSRAGPATLLSLGAVALFGVTAALTKTVVVELGEHGLYSLRHWPIWMLVVVGIGGQVFNQAAYQLAELAVSFPVITAGEPLVTAVIGVGLFGEHLSTAGWRGPGMATAVVLLLVGVVILTRSVVGLPPTPPTPAAVLARSGQP